MDFNQTRNRVGCFGNQFKGNDKKHISKITSQIGKKLHY